MRRETSSDNDGKMVGGEFTARGFSSLDRFSLTRLDAEPVEPGRILPAHTHTHTHRTPEEETS